MKTIGDYPPYRPELREWVTAGPATTDEYECIFAAKQIGVAYAALDANLNWAMLRRKFRA